ncbi:MAG: UDP-galactopyranose mutase [Lactococcus lactis]|uniref:UDP-galactopyranose mutase n=1 Tax=Lactococcus lactis subsp. cremoris TaxID=1359 RepID=A0A896T9P0_LACLC|nr:MULTISPECIES: UDP-galactopyranose mutase [Lactococcus]MCT4400163.1 UDP-galactopyranose mutase [Lactococcus cremoris]MCT4429153.1 UDP-galactopyranose mutase [Lactococcus cremoris]MDU1628959.1 UDP-galactopyranose mutase [Lactococcus lactis]MDU2185686.1 UDP-galactopyranose mutase [Lactococcus lactis]WKB12721.1 UDP-galactopyranose mutase [Lactococcus cremoris]
MKHNTKNYDYLIIGAGPYGSVFAFEAAKRGKRSLIIERRSTIGGNMASHKEHGINVHDFGAHIFHTDNKEVWEYINQFTEFNGYINQVVADYKGERYNLPFNMNTFYQMWGVKTPEEAHEKIITQKEAANITGIPKNLEEQAISLIGKDIYSRLIKGYTEKQWGRKAVDLPPFIIRRLPVRFTYDNNYFNHRYQGIPIDGYTPIFEKMYESDLIDVKLNTDFFESKDAYLTEFPKIIYTGMIDQFFDYKFGELEYRSVRFESETFESNNKQGSAVINYTDSETPYTRIMEWRHFDKKADDGYTILTKEYPQDWDKTKEAYYPINDEKNSSLFKKYKKESRKFENILFGGRLGNYQYYDMDQVISLALKAVKKEFGE